MELHGKRKRDRPKKRFTDVVKARLGRFGQMQRRDAGNTKNRMLRMELPGRRKGVRPNGMLMDLDSKREKIQMQFPTQILMLAFNSRLSVFYIRYLKRMSSKQQKDN